jgi:hypothetical protein
MNFLSAFWNLLTGSTAELEVHGVQSTHVLARSSLKCPQVSFTDSKLTINGHKKITASQKLINQKAD